MVGHPLPLPQAQELAQRKTVGAAPLDPALALDALEIADKMHPEVPARPDRRRPHLRCVVQRTQRLAKSIKIVGHQNLLKAVVKTWPGDRDISAHVTINSL